MTDVRPTVFRKVAALAVKWALRLPGLLFVSFILAWPSYLLLFALALRRAQLLPPTIPLAIFLTLVQCTHWYLLLTNAAFFCFNRRLFWILRAPLPPLLMFAVSSKLLLTKTVWHRDTKRDARAALEGMSDEEKRDLRSRLLPTNEKENHRAHDSASLWREVTLLFLKQLKRKARSNLRTKINRCYQPRRITTRSALAEYDLSMEDFRMLYLGEARKVVANLQRKSDGAKGGTATAHSNMSLHMEIIDQFLQRALLFFLCPNALIDRYYDAHGKYCAMSFSYRLDNEVGWEFSPQSNVSKKGRGAVLLWYGYFCLEAEKDSGIWHYSFVRSMLRGFVSGLCDELSVQELSSSFWKEAEGQCYNNIQYVNIGANEDYTKRVCGAVGANIWEHPDTVKEIFQTGMFKEIADNKETNRCKSGWLDVKPEI
ncbi:hypothetical protein ACHAWF_013831 [Thalassiosira exigua]